MSYLSETTFGSDRKFLKSAMASPLLELEHERELARKWRDEEDEAALHELTTAYVRLVISRAARFRKYGLPMSDLIQEGNIGLMQAAARFEPEREVRFSTYASWWIRAAIQDYVLRNWSIVRTGTTAAQKSLFFNLRRLRAQIDDMSDANMSAETRTWIATQLGVNERDVDTMNMRLSASDKSLNAPISNDGDAEFQDLLPDDAGSPEDTVMADRDANTRHEWILEAMKTLSPREAIIIEERRLKDDGSTLQSLGDQLGISKERVRQIEQVAMQKLKKALIRIAGSEEELVCAI